MQLVFTKIGCYGIRFTVYFKAGIPDPVRGPTDHTTKIGVLCQVSRGVIVFHFIKSQHNIIPGILGSRDRKRSDYSTVIRDTGFCSGYITQGEQIYIFSRCSGEAKRFMQWHTLSCVVRGSLTRLVSM